MWSTSYSSWFPPAESEPLRVSRHVLLPRSIPMSCSQVSLRRQCINTYISIMTALSGTCVHLLMSEPRDHSHLLWLHNMVQGTFVTPMSFNTTAEGFRFTGCLWYVPNLWTWSIGNTSREWFQRSKIKSVRFQWPFVFGHDSQLWHILKTNW